MKSFLVSIFLLWGLSLNANFLLIPLDAGDPLVVIDPNAIEKITQLPYSSLIFEAEQKQNCNYLLAQVQTEKGVEYFDGKMTHEFYKKNKIAPNGKSSIAISYFILTPYEKKQKRFFYFISEDKPDVDKFFSANNGNINDQLQVGKELVEQKRTKIAKDLLIKAWQNGSYLTQWKAYKEFEKIKFPNDPKDKFISACQRTYFIYCYLRDIFWPK